MEDNTPKGINLLPYHSVNLDAAIAKITMTIRNQYPKLISYLKVASVADKNTQTQDLTASTKKAYLEMLTVALQKYKEEHTKDENGNAKVKTGAPD